MRFANYGRKSIFSEKSDSIDNQFRMCKEYVEMHFPGQIESFATYSDEDFTGANTNRPDLKRLLADIEIGMYDAVVVYQLDRLSRDVRDFANIYSMLEQHNVMFISIKENIDTTTPIGKAMMYVTVVFAQMERETIAARVTDNMIGLAKKGYWTGGNPPYGYTRKQIVVNGKKHVTIVPDPDGVKYTTWIFDTFLNNGYSLQGMETAFKKQGIRTINGAFFSTTQLYAILTMPFCVEATPEIYDFFEAKGCNMATSRDKWDGKHGVMVYGRSTTKNNKHQKKPPSEWIVTIGIHEPFISANKWLAVQTRFSQNKFDKTMKYDTPLLKGVLYCSCGSIMNVSRKKKISGGVSSWYYCLKRMRQGVDVCPNSHQIKCEFLDEKILQVFQSIITDKNEIYKYISKEVISPKPDIKTIKAKISTDENKIDKLLSSLVVATGSVATKYIVHEIEKLDIEIQALKREQAMVVSEEHKIKQAEKDTESKIREIERLMQGLEGFSAQERNEIAKSVIRKCIWDGETLHLQL